MNKNENQMSIMNWVQYFRNKMYNSISWGSLQSDASIMTCLIGDNIPWSHLSKSALNNMTLAQNSDEFCVIVQYWKFANARLYRENEKIVIDAKTDYLLSYLATEQENAKNRRGDEKSDSVTEGVEKDMQLLAKLFFVDEEDIDELCIEKIEVKKWLLFLWNLKVCSTEAFSTILSPFVNLTQINKSNLLSSQGLKTKINNQELKFIINKLSFTEKDVTRKDLFDLPIIAGKYLFTPALLYVHPLYIVYSLLQKQINIGNYFENYLLRKISPRYISWHSINQPKSIKEDHETDILFLDQQNTPAFMECKTFGSPTALKKYITEIDKMYSLRYLINDNASYGHIAFFINYLRTPHTDNLRYKDTSGKLINLNIHFKYIDRAYGLFVSNLFFPISLVKLWRKYKLHFIYYKDLCSSLKTINGINKNEIIFTEKNAPSIFEKIEKNEDNNFFNMSKFRIQKRCRSLEQFNIIIKEYGSL